MCKLELTPLVRAEQQPEVLAQQLLGNAYQGLSSEESEQASLALRQARKTMLLKNSILRRLGPTPQLNLNLHWGYLERVMVKKENLPPLYQP